MHSCASFSPHAPLADANTYTEGRKAFDEKDSESVFRPCISWAVCGGGWQGAQLACAGSALGGRSCSVRGGGVGDNTSPTQAV